MDRQVVTPYYQDSTVTLHHGDSLDVLRTLPDGSVDCCVTSPPYYGLRSYLPGKVVLRDDLTATELAHVVSCYALTILVGKVHDDADIPAHLRDFFKPAEIGAEKTPAEFVERLRELFAEVRRVLADDGTLWLNLGDSYSSKTKGTGGSGKSTLVGTPADRNGQNFESGNAWQLSCGVPEKNLLGIPWRVAFALQDDSWILRNAIVWNKPNAMPESVTDRLSTRYEMLFMFSKSRKYWFDLDPIRDKYSDKTIRTYPTEYAPGQGAGTNGSGASSLRLADNPLGRNPGDVWDIPTTPFPGSHFAVFPPELPRRCIVAGCKPGGTVLDPFHGSGTTGMVATRNGRKYVGIELNREYIDLSLRTRLADGVLDFGEDTA